VSAWHAAKQTMSRINDAPMMLSIINSVPRILPMDEKMVTSKGLVRVGESWGLRWLSLISLTLFECGI
jgi:hypothetical protein